MTRRAPGRGETIPGYYGAIPDITADQAAKVRALVAVFVPESEVDDLIACLGVAL